MSITLDELLALVGRLDDAPGFDTPRERLRRFLLEHITDVEAARSLVDECQRSVGEQRHRALQDLIVLVGRFLGFDTTFGAYDHSMHPISGLQRPSRAEDAAIAGRWRSRGLLEVVLEIRTDQTNSVTLESLSRALAAPVDQPRAENEARIGLCVMARHYTGRTKLEQSVAPETRQGAELRIVSVRSLLALATQVSADRVSHDEVVKLFKSGFALDFVIDLLDRPAQAAGAIESSTGVPPAPLIFTDHRDVSFFVATVTGNDMAGPDQMVAAVIAHRRMLGIRATLSLPDLGSPGDWVAFFLPAKGMVGHAQLASIVDGAVGVRNADHFSRVYRLANVDLYEEPIVQALRAGRPFAVPEDGFTAGPSLAPISRQDFVALTQYRDRPGSTEPALRPVAGFDAATERKWRSHG